MLVWVSIHLSVCMSVANFFLNLFSSFILKFFTAIETRKQKKVIEADFLEKFLFSL